VNPVYDSIGGVEMDMAQEYKLDINRLVGDKPNIISTKEALSDVAPIQWEDDVVNGKKKVILTKPKNDTEE
jgi:hypothetical protein